MSKKKRGRKLVISFLVCLLVFSTFQPLIPVALATTSESYTYISSDTTLSVNDTVGTTLVIAPNVTLTIASGTEYIINGNIIIYGNLTNYGKLTVNGDVFANNYNNMFFGDPSNPAGKFTNYGNVTITNLFVKTSSYPIPFLNFVDLIDGDVVSSQSLEVTAEAFPGLQFELNNIGGTVPSDGVLKENITLQEGPNEISASVTDPFGNKASKTITITYSVDPDGGDPGQVPGGGIYEDTVWTKDKSPYIVTGDIVIFPGKTLTIEPGVEVKFAANAGMTIRGKLISEGTELEPIRFMAKVNDVKGSWKGISIDGVKGGGASLNYTEVRNAVTGVNLLCCSSEVGNGLTVKNSLIENNQIGLTGGVGYEDFIITNTLFKNNGHGIYDIRSANILNSQFVNNETGVERISSLSLVYNSEFVGNDTGVKDFHYSQVSSSTFKQNNLAISTNGSSSQITNNTIIENDEGIRIQGVTSVRNNNIHHNKVGMTIDGNTDETHSNNISTNTEYNVKNLTDNDRKLPSNWWGSANLNEIKSLIYDGYDDPQLGLLDLSAFSSSSFSLEDITGPIWRYGHGLYVSDTTETSASISWHVYSIEDNSGVKEFNIFVNDKLVKTIDFKQSSSRYTVTNLEPGKEYTVKVEAVDYKGHISTNGPSSKFNTLDQTPPKAPIVDEVTDQSTKVSGTAEANSRISVKGEYEIGEATTGPDGTFTVDISTQKAGQVLLVTSIDSYNNISEATKVTVKDVTAPVLPRVDMVTDQSREVTGGSEPNSTIKIKSGTTMIGSAKVNASGTYNVPIPLQKADTILEITATDEAGNTTKPVKIKVSDMTPPSVPEVNEVTDQSDRVTGKGEVGSTIQVDTNAMTIGSAPVKSDGTFSVPIPKQIAGTKLWINAVDSSANFSAIEITVKDVTAPQQPAVNEVNDTSTTVTGSAEAGSRITVKTGTTILGTATTNNEGKYSVAIAKQKAGTKLIVTATDSSGNISTAKEVTVKDKTAPSVPAVNEVTDASTTVTGTSEVGSTIMVKTGTTVLGTGTASSDGKYSVTIGKQKAETVLTVTATDSAGNVSPGKEVIVKDVTAPSIPTVNEVTDASTAVTGIAEASSTVTVKTGTTMIGTVTASSEGKYSVPISKQKAGIKLTVFATDSSGNKSESTEIPVKDGTAPSRPTVTEVTDKSTSVTGGAEVGSTITVFAGIELIGTGSANQVEMFNVPILKQQEGTLLTVVATDAAGNESDKVIVKVRDVTAPAAPTVDQVTDQTTAVTGNSEAGSTVSLKVGHVNLGTVIANPEGRFDIPIPKQKAGTMLEFTATDAVGNVSEIAKVTVLKTAAEETDRIAGASRYSTAVAISQKGWETADTVILATGANFPDALAGGPLAYKLNAPILLTKPTSLLEETQKEIQRLKARKVIILGSEGAISQKVVDKLDTLGVVIERIGGKNRFDTAALIAKRLPSDEAVIAYGFNFPDVLSISPYAAKNGIPILLTRSDKVPVETKSAMSGKAHTIIVGSKGAISDEVMNQFPQPVRYGGKTRFDTGNEIISKLPLGTEKAFIATGRNFPDALAGSVLAAKQNAPILLVNQNDIPTVTNDLISNYDDFTVLGSPGAVSDEVKLELDRVLMK